MTRDKTIVSFCFTIAFLFLSMPPALAASSGNVVNVPAAPNPTDAVIGGEATLSTDAADGNTVNINYDVAIPSRTEDIAISVVGGFAKGTGSASNNTVNITAGTTNGAVIGGYVYSNDVALGLFGSADNNSVTISNAAIGGPVYGGYNNYTVDDVGSEPNSANNNTVVITGGSVAGNVTGGRSYDEFKSDNPIDPRSDAGSADNNSVTIDGGAVINGTVTGGDSYADAIGNTITLKNGTINGDVIGGNGENYHAGGASRFESQNNTINLYEGSITGSVLGSSTTGAGDDNPFFGNTLNVYGQRWTVEEVNMFQNYNFVLPADVADNPTPIFTVTNPTNLYNTFDQDGNVLADGTTSVLNSASIIGGGSALSDGQEIVLISQVTNSSSTYYETQDHVPVQQGFSNMCPANRSSAA